MCCGLCAFVSSVPAISSGYTASQLAENPRSVRRLSDWKVTDIVSLALTITGGMRKPQCVPEIDGWGRTVGKRWRQMKRAEPGLGEGFRECS